MRTHVFTLLFCLYVFSGNSQTGITSSQQNTQVGLSEGQAYKMLYENQKESNSSMLSTIYCIIGVLGAAVFTFHVAEWWVNKEKLAAIEKNLMNEIETVKSLLNKDIENLKEIINEKDTSIHQKITRLEESISNLNQHSQSHGAKMHKLEATMWQRTGAIQNALLKYIKETEINLESMPHKLSISLNNIYECLDDLQFIGKSSLKALNDLIQKFPEDHEKYPTIKEIEDLIRELPVQD